MNVLGMGIITARGCGVDSFEQALIEGWIAPDKLKSEHAVSGSYAYQVDLGSIPDRSVLRKMRRSDKLSKMSVAAASEALKKIDIDSLDGTRVGVITATGLGAHVTTFSFLNDILQYGEANVSPTAFSNSVHNAAASYISSALNIEGPTLTVTQFHFSFHSALQLARCWLNEKRCDYVLVGAVEQYGDVLAYIHDEKLSQSPDGKIKPFNFNPAYNVPGEGAVFFLVSSREDCESLCKVEDVMVNVEAVKEEPVDINIIDTDGIIEDESVYKSALSPDRVTSSYTPLFGTMMTGSAFNFAAAVLMINRQTVYANPVTDNPHNLNIACETKSAIIELIRCIRYNCYGKKASIYLCK